VLGNGAAPAPQLIGPLEPLHSGCFSGALLPQQRSLEAVDRGRAPAFVLSFYDVQGFIEGCLALGKLTMLHIRLGQ
jgi:hypothetical protein